VPMRLGAFHGATVSAVERAHRTGRAVTAVVNSRSRTHPARVVTPPLFATSQFLADGRSVVIADEYAGSVYRWDPRPDYAIEFACRLAGRDLTKAEWAEQFGDRTFHETCPT